MYISVGLDVLRRSFLVSLRRAVVVEGKTPALSGPKNNWVIFGMMLGKRWKAELRGGLLSRHTHFLRARWGR